MSEFVPFRPSAGFSAALVKAPLPPPEDTPAVIEPAEAPAPTPAPDLDALIAAAEARGEARARAALAEQEAGLATRRAELEAMLQQVESARRSDRTETRQLVGSLIIASMRRLIGEHPILREAALSHAFAQAVAGMIGDRDVVLWVAPEQEELAQRLIADRDGWTVRTSADVRAGLQVVGPRGRLDSSLMTALMAMEAAVNTWLEEP